MVEDHLTEDLANLPAGVHNVDLLPPHVLNTNNEVFFHSSLRAHAAAGLALEILKLFYIYIGKGYF